MADALKLRAEDDEDLAVISAILQDALVTVGEMAYLPDDKRFVLIANRFRWEPDITGERQDFERILSGLRIDGVCAVQRRDISLRDKDGILALLAIQAQDNALYLHFAGGGSIRLEIERILCHLDDLGEPWPTRWRPRHPVGDGGRSG
jgi:hypothetical protein